MANLVMEKLFEEYWWWIPDHGNKESKPGQNPLWKISSQT